MKTCKKCKLEKPLDRFEKTRNTCKDCRRHTPEYNRNWKYKKKYGITLDEYNEILEAQGGKCYICKTTEPGGAGYSFTVDHNHETKEVRGLLCCNCNRGLGYFRDNPATLLAAAQYLLDKGHYG